jgi:hypothetical protein
MPKKGNNEKKQDTFDIYARKKTSKKREDFFTELA